MAEHVPTEIKLRSTARTLAVTFEDGTRHELPCEYLRVYSPSAEVKGHGPNDRRTPTGKEQVAISEVQPVGNYAVRLVFDDGHDSGIYAWDYLYQLGVEYAQRWAAYLDELEALGYQRKAR